MNDSQTAKAGNSLHPTLGYPVGCVVKHCGWKIPRAGSWRYGLVLAHRDDVCCLQIDFGSYTAWVNPHAMMHLIRVDNASLEGRGTVKPEQGAAFAASLSKQLLATGGIYGPRTENLAGTL